MGCGASRAAGSFVERDPEDYELEFIDIKLTKILQVDELLDKAEAPLNTIVELNNNLNEGLSKVKDAVAVLTGALRMQLAVVKATDTITLHLVKAADGASVHGAPVVELLNKPDVAKADTEVRKAFDALEKALQGAEAKLFANDKGEVSTSSGADSEVKKFNEAVSALGKAIGSTYKINVKVTPTAVSGKDVVQAEVCGCMGNNTCQPGSHVRVSLTQV